MHGPLADLVEEVAGEIHDEFDQEELSRLRPVGAGIIVARGDVLLDELVECLSWSFPTMRPRTSIRWVT